MAIGGYPPHKTATVKNFIVAGNELDLSRNKLMMKALEGGVIFPYQSVTTRFSNALNKYITEYTFEAEEWERYIYQPKRFCMDYYGTPELWADILYINHMVSALDFNRQRIKVFTDGIIEGISELQAIYADDLANNRVEVGLQ